MYPNIIIVTVVFVAIITIIIIIIGPFGVIVIRGGWTPLYNREAVRGCCLPTDGFDISETKENKTNYILCNLPFRTR